MESNGQPEVASPELLGILRAAKAAVDIAEMEFKAVSRYVTAHYNMQGTDVLDLGTGVITRAQTVAPPELPPQEIANPQ